MEKVARDSKYLAGLAPLVLVVLAGCSGDDSAISCGGGTTLVGKQCVASQGDATASADAPASGGQDGAADAGQGGEAGSGDDASAEWGDDASSEADAADDAPAEATTNTTCGDGGADSGGNDPCPGPAAIDCSNTCSGAAACTFQPTGCAWNGDAGVSVQVDGMNLAIVRTPAGQLDTTGCDMNCGEGGADHASFSFVITSSNQWAKFTVPAPWRVVDPKADVCHPADNHCILSRSGAVILAPTACMPATNIIVEPISSNGTTSCP